LLNFNPVFARCGKFLVIAALVMTTGAHWAALQTIAWTTMLAANLSTDSLTEAVTKTFDGEHPCPLCKAIAAGKKSEKKSETIAPALKMEFPMMANTLLLNPPAQFAELPVPDFFAEPLSAKPPVPPPRSLPV
jgi:hypothetical protein